MTDETIDEATREQFRRTNRVLLISAAVMAVAIGAFALFMWMQGQREDAERVDGYYCTLSGIGPYDIAPETGKTCAEILTS